MTIVLAVGERRRRVAEATETEAKVLASSEARFRSLVENSSDFLLVLGTDRKVVLQSAAGKRMFGLGEDALVGRDVVDWVHPDDRDHVLQRVDSAEDGPIAGALLECRVRHADGTWPSVEVAVSRLLDDPNVGGRALEPGDVADHSDNRCGGRNADARNR
ncbi:MAG: PAS domain S-box protein [Candidatus Dormibacteria bacterium]